jgi:hypothetical protein
MTYDQFKQAWVEALRESMLPTLGVEPVEESLGLRAMERHVRSVVEPFGGQHAGPFHVTAALAYRWDALQTARTATTEEDLLGRLLGREGIRTRRTAHPWLRVDVTLRASTQWGKELALPPPHAWQRWARETLGRLETIEPLLPSQTVREGRGGLPEILAWQGEPELRGLCSPTGDLKLRGVEVAAWQAIEVPRRWDDPARRPDKPPDAQLAAMFKRLRAAMNAWMEALDHLTPPG